MPSNLPRRYPEGDGLDDMNDRDLRDLAIEYDVLPTPPPKTNRDPARAGDMMYLNEDQMLPSYSARIWLITELRKKGAKNPYIAMARQESFSDDDIVSVDNQGRITVVRRGADGATTYQ